VGTFLSHIIAELCLKRVGVKRSKIGWFWLIEILLSIIIIKYIENIIEAIVHLATGTWSPGQAFEGITGMLGIASAVIVGLILFLLYFGKIKVEDRHPYLKFFEIVWNLLYEYYI
jgi:phage-related holin